MKRYLKKNAFFLSFFFILAIFWYLKVVNREQNDHNLNIRIFQNESLDRLDVVIDDVPFTSYLYHDSLKKPVLYPLRSAKGTEITRGWPLKPRAFERTDHPHHIGCWLSFGDVNNHDFWNNSFAIPKRENARYGSIKHKQILEIHEGTDTASFKVLLHWIDNSGNLLLKEKTTFHFSGDRNRRIVDRNTQLTAVENVVFEDSKEGLFAVRMAREFESPSDRPLILTDVNGTPMDSAVLENTGVDGHYTASNGLEGQEVWGTSNKWVALSASINNDSVSVVIMDHPENPGHPPCYHARDYGLFAVNNFGQQSYQKEKDPVRYTLRRNESYTFKHRLIIKNNGFYKVDELEKEYLVFAD